MIGALAFNLQVANLLATAIVLAPTIVELAVVIFAGMLLANIMQASGAQRVISEYIKSSAHTRARGVLMVTFGMSSFFETSIGFGVGFVATLPLLMSFGYSASRSVMLALLGMVLSPWGVMGQAFVVAEELTELPLQSIGLWGAIAVVPLVVTFAAAILFTAFPRHERLKQAGEFIWMVLPMIIVLCICSQFISVRIAGLLAAFSVIITGFLRGSIQRHQENLVAMKDRGKPMLFASAPFIALIGGLMVTQAVPMPDIPPWNVVSSPAFWLFVAAACATSFGKNRATSWQTLRQTSRAWFVPGTTVVLYVFMGVILIASGMSSFMASAISASGHAAVATIPGISLIAGFVTGSGSAASAMLAPGISAVSPGLGWSPSQGVAIQVVAASIGTIVNPAKFVLAQSILLGNRLSSNVAPRTMSIVAVASSLFLVTGVMFTIT